MSGFRGIGRARFHSWTLSRHRILTRCRRLCGPWPRFSFVEVLGLRIYVREAGAGEPVLLLHGLGVSGRYFVPLASVLAARRHVIVPDLPGWGRSERPSRPLGLGGAADVLCELLRRRGRGAVSIVANSFGCQVALMLAQRRPELVGGRSPQKSTVDPRYRSWSVHAARLALDTLRDNRPRCGASCSPTTRAWALDGSPRRRRRHSKIVLRTASQAFGSRSS